MIFENWWVTAYWVLYTSKRSISVLPWCSDSWWNAARIACQFPLFPFASFFILPSSPVCSTPTRDIEDIFLYYLQPSIKDHSECMHRINPEIHDISSTSCPFPVARENSSFLNRIATRNLISGLFPWTVFFPSLTLLTIIILAIFCTTCSLCSSRLDAHSFLFKTPILKKPCVSGLRRILRLIWSSKEVCKVRRCCHYGDLHLEIGFPRLFCYHTTTQYNNSPSYYVSKAWK